MNYKEINLATPVYKLDFAKMCVRKLNIVSIKFIPQYHKEKLLIVQSVLILSMRDNLEQWSFALDKKGNLRDESLIYFFSRQEANEELVILKTKNERNLGLQDLFEEGEHR